MIRNKPTSGRIGRKDPDKPPNRITFFTAFASKNGTTNTEQEKSDG